MSALLYPTLPGLSIEVPRSYVWRTANQEAVSGKMSALGTRVYPLVHWEHTYNVLRDVGAPGYGTATLSEIQAIAGLHNAMQGRVDTFLFSDPDFNTITSATANQYGVFATGNGTVGPFQLVATYQNVGGPGAQELIQNLNGTPVLYDNGTIISAANYSIGVTGQVTFASGHAPVTGHTLTWSGNWYYRCRFDEDALVYKKFMTKLWALEVKFTSIKL